MEKFYIGADIGTESVGIACTDENYNLLRAKGKDCWTVRLFDKGETAAKRRSFRTARRRLARRKQRINLLQDLFAPYIEDATFFIRLNNSMLLPEDKDELLSGDKNNLFAGKYDDKEFYTEFPTIYHLRDKLIKGGDYDLRLYYLAIHHIIKYRGHFLKEGSVEDVRDFSKLLQDLNDVIKGFYEGEIPEFSPSSGEKAKKILLDDKKSGKDKQRELEEMFCADTKQAREIIKGMLGVKISPKVLFGEGYEEEKSFSFKEVSDEAFEEMKQTYDDDFSLLAAVRAVYGYVAFEKILKDKDNISSAMIAVYEKHKDDLNRLKKFIKGEPNADYGKIFRKTNEKNNYVNYIGYTKKDGKKTKVEKCKKDDDFFSYLEKYLSSLTDVKDEKTRDEIIKEIKDGTFLPKIAHSDNGLFPKQINEVELDKIVNNMVKNHPETATIKNKIKPLFNFRVPYYVGPLTGVNSWAVKKNDEKITPWNFDDVIDKAKTNEAFMRKMTCKCTYLRGEDVLPKSSILYQKYDVLNQLNKLTINETPVSIELKQKIFNDLFLKYPKVDNKKIREYLVKCGYVSAADANDIALGGKDGDFKASMSSYIRLKNILGDFVDKDLADNTRVCENIILWHTLNTDKKIVADLIEKNYGDIPEIKNNVKQLKGLTFNDFGRFSERFLSGITAVDKSTGEILPLTIMDVLYETNENLNEILFDERYNFNETIQAENGERQEVTYDTLKELYVSPAVRRGLWQTLTVIDEYVNAIGRNPDKIFVEVTRESGAKGDEGKTQPRKKQLLKKYETITEGYADVIQRLGKEEYTDAKLRRERLYLYFRQLGRCMYTGKEIYLDKINDYNLYDVDHIIPRALTKDDSLDNKVLVCREKNVEKKDEYPLPAGLANAAARKHWELLLNKKLISRTTYDRLVRTAPLTKEDYDGFINRQKVITDQTAKAAIELLKIKYPDAKLVYSKAKNVNDFKNEFKLFKCRETNDLHHARDAYLNVVVGNVYDRYFEIWKHRIDKERSLPDGGKYDRDLQEGRTFDVEKVFRYKVSGAWNKTEHLDVVNKTFTRRSMSVTYYATRYNGMFYEQNATKKRDSATRIAPIKGKGALSDVSKYGGYNSLSTAFFAIVSSVNKKGERVKTIEAIPVLAVYGKEDVRDAVTKYIVDDLKLKEPKVIVPQVKKRQLVSYNGTLCCITAITGNQIIAHNATQLFTDNKTDEYVKKLVKLLDEYAKGFVKDDESRYVVDKEQNEKLYSDLKAKLDEKRFEGLSAFKTFKKNLEKGEEAFKELSVLNQSKVLLQIFKFFKCNGETADLTLIDGSGRNGRGRSGTIYINKDITDVDFRLIDLSPAGLTEKVRKV